MKGQNTLFYTNKTLNVGGQAIDLALPHVMGILNVTPDSFYDGGKFTSDTSILAQAEKMLREGATFIDIGGYSSRPNAEDIPLETERERAVHAVSLIAKTFPDALLSVDTFRSEVAHACLQEGAALVNDITGGEDPGMAPVIARHGAPYVLMHMRGNPRTMAAQTDYNDLLLDITGYFHQKVHALRAMGVKDILIDPGFGFAKTLEQNFFLLNHLDHFRTLSLPILVGLSRKSMIWKTLGCTPKDALNGTTALHAMALMGGASVLRAHDVKEAKEAIQLYTMLKRLT